MAIKILVKVKIVSENYRVESFGSNRYLVYSSSKSENEVNSLISKHLGTPLSKILIKSIDSNGNMIMELG